MKIENQTKSNFQFSRISLVPLKKKILSPTNNKIISPPSLHQSFNSLKIKILNLQQTVCHWRLYHRKLSLESNILLPRSCV